MLAIVTVVYLSLLAAPFNVVTALPSVGLPSNSPSPSPSSCFTHCLDIPFTTCTLTKDHGCSCHRQEDLQAFHSCMHNSCSASQPIQLCSLSDSTQNISFKPLAWIPSLTHHIFPRISKAQQEQQTARKNTRTWAIIGSLLAAIIITFFSLAFYRKHKREAAMRKGLSVSHYHQDHLRGFYGADKGAGDIPWIPPHQAGGQDNMRVPPPVLPTSPPPSASFHTRHPPALRGPNVHTPYATADIPLSTRPRAADQYVSRKDQRTYAESNISPYDYNGVARSGMATPDRSRSAGRRI